MAENEAHLFIDQTAIAEDHDDMIRIVHLELRFSLFQEGQ
jgi:hypothetical protein